MSLELLHWLIVIYVAGMLICSLGSIQFLVQRYEIKKTMDIDLFQTRPDLKSYLFLKPIFWPYFFVTEKKPIDRVSELLFKHYGDEGHTYFRDHGIKNFLRDVINGKNRYKNYQVSRLLWPVDKNGVEYQERKSHFNDGGKPVYVEIIWAHYQEKFFLGVTFGSKECLSDNKPVSRFQLDQCKLINASQFQQRLLQINHTRATEFLSQYQQKN